MTPMGADRVLQDFAWKHDVPTRGVGSAYGYDESKTASLMKAQSLVTTVNTTLQYYKYIVLYCSVVLTVVTSDCGFKYRETGGAIWCEITTSRSSHAARCGKSLDMQ